MSLDIPPMRWRDARFEDSRIETGYLAFSWPGERFQSALVLLGFSLAWLVSIGTDIAYLSVGSLEFLGMAAARVSSGLFGIAAGGWMLWAGARVSRPVGQALVHLWLALSTVTGIVVSSFYPFTGTTPEAVSETLVFNSFWMSTQMLGLGAALAARTTGIQLAAMAYAVAYLVGALYWNDRLPSPMLGTSIVVVSACLFAIVLSLAFSLSGRRRYYTTWKYEEARRDAEKAREFSSFLLSTASHDIRQPIYSLDLNATAMEQLAERGDWDRVGGMIRNQRLVLRSVSSLLSSILEFSDRDFGGRETSSAGMPLRDVFASQCAAFEALARHRGIRLHIAETDLAVQADPGVVEHVLHNLISNALTHSNGTRILVGARRRGDRIALVVADDGRAGAGAEPAGRGAASEGINPKVSGLGTSIMYRLAELGGLELAMHRLSGGGRVCELLCPRA